nr:MAG TPA: hypothetical protein [Bacteriophage sp.]
MKFCNLWGRCVCVGLFTRDMLSESNHNGV